MAVTNPVTVPKKKITSTDITGFSGGLFENGEQNGEENQFVEGRDVELTINGLLGPRKSLTPFLPPTVENAHQRFPAKVGTTIRYYVGDENKVKWCEEGDDEWTDCTGDNTITTQNGGKVKFLRVLDSLLILNGKNGDKLAYVDLETNDVVKYTFVANPAVAPTAAPTGITNSGAYKIYYGYTFSSPTGETEISPILEYTINKIRSTWDPDGGEYLTVSRPAGNPAGSTYWNLYIALAANGGTIQPSDMLMLAGGLDLNTLSVADNGTLAIDIGRGNPPTTNSTDGPRVEYGIETNGRPVVYGDQDEPDNVWIGGDGEFARDFSSANGGFRSQPIKGTNYYPASVIGFRNGQGIPSLTILFSNTEGLSKQATLEQQTINYGNQSFVVWGVTEQNYGAAGVASSLGVVNYKGQLSAPSSDGFFTMDTAPQLQNVIATQEIDKNVKPSSKRIKVSALNEIVGTGWESRNLWTTPADGFDEPNEIWIRDMNNNGAWYKLAIPAQWIGTISPPDSPAFVYIAQGPNTYKLFEAFGTVDYKPGGAETFSTYARGTRIGFNEAHNSYQALVQVVFYVLDIIGTVTVGVTYKNQNGKLKTKTKTFEGPVYTRSTGGGWSDPQYLYNTGPTPARWSDFVQILTGASGLTRQDKRIVVPVNDLASEVQWFIETPNGYCDWLLKAISYEGENLGVKPDLR